MAYHLIHRCADALGEAMVAEWRGVRAICCQEVMHCCIQLVCGYTRLDEAAC